MSTQESAVHHAVLSPSSSSRWLTAGCTGSPALNYGGQDTSNKYSDEGTAAHAMLEWCLIAGLDADDFPDSVIHVLETGEAWHGPGDTPAAIRNSFEADVVMREHIQVVIDDIQRHAKGNEIIAEERVYFAAALGVPEEFGSGTADARVRDLDEHILQVHDLKYGASPRGIVFAGSPEHPNSQLALYGVGSWVEDEVLDDWEGVELHVHQPRLGHKDMVRLTKVELGAFIQSARAAAAEALQGFKHSPDGALLTDEAGKLVPRTMEELHADGMLRPSAAGCRYCAVSDTCLALRQKNRATIVDHFEVLGDEPVEPILKVLDKPVPTSDDLTLLETFIAAVKERVREKLKAGEAVPGWKLVKGQRGARAWITAKVKEVEELMKSRFRLKTDEMYDRKLISPTKAEKVLKDSPKRWAQLEDYITRSEGKESLAADTDKREEVKHANVKDEFEDLDDLI